MITLLCALALIGGQGQVPVEHHVATEAVTGDADDPAIWIHPTDPGKSRIIGTDKVEPDKGGGLHVFDLQGKKIQVVPLDRPNNVDVEQGVDLGSGVWDIAVAAERGKKRLAIYRIDPADGKLVDASGNTSVFASEAGERGAPMGIAIYKRPKDGAVFAIVSRKEGPTEGYLWQYRLVSSAGRIDARFVRSFGSCSEGGEIEALLVDDALGFVYAAEEKFGIRKYSADPEGPEANREVAVFGKTGFPEDREGLGLYATGPKAGFILCSDQREGGSYLRVFPREGDVHAEIMAIPTKADGTDGIEVVSSSFPGFPKGFVVMMNSSAKNFLVYPWEKLAGL